jgi:phosphoglycolate phosphatase
MNKRFAIFDLDGTLLNTLDDLCDSINHILKVHGFPQHSIDDVRRFV